MSCIADGGRGMARRRGARDAGRHHRQGGFALLIVLWTMVLLALLVTHITATGRSEARIAGGVRNAAMAQAAADSAVRQTIFRLLDNSAAHWQADGTTHVLRVAGGGAEVRIEDEAGKIDLNAAPLPVLARLLHAVGVDEAQSAALAAAIIDWRTVGEAPQPAGAKAPQYAAAGRPYGPPDADFQSIDELSLVLGATPDIVHRLAPHVTVYGSGDIDLGKADPVVAEAMKDAGGAQATNSIQGDGFQPQPLTANITAVALVNGARFGRRAIVVIRGGSREQPAPYRIVSWTRMAE